MIAFSCSHCGRKLKAPDSQAGKKAKCPQCGQRTEIPQPAIAAAPSGSEAPTLAPPISHEAPTQDVPPARPSEAATLAPNGTHPALTASLPPRIDIPGYEILGELGRGGMGVIYKARQLQPRRLVALKMILAGEYADANALARFHSEAEAVARLSHANIVQIHQVGEHAGRPYLTLEFVEGGNLAQRLREQPYDFQAAAELVEALARAMQFAHQRGIIHRDLKPANILLTGEGTPKITDFGLAKQIEGSLAPAARTQSGAILGTPSYMAPEQAEGKSKNIGPPADIYALGAILYELVTNRPPFQAETMLDTLIQVATAEPPPPRQLNKKCPRDLETICLKCLCKIPSQRYASAGELADDLRRWRQGEAIQARPVGRIKRIGRALLRRNQLIYIAAGIVSPLIWVVVSIFFPDSSDTQPQPQAQPVVPILPEEAARRRLEAAQVSDANNLRQLAMAMHNFNNVYKFLPPAAIMDQKTGKPLLSWRVALLPFVEQQLLYQQFKLDEPWDSENNKKLLPYMPNIFKMSGAKQTQDRSGCFYQVFVGPGAAFEASDKPNRYFGREGPRMTDFLDGTANTLLIVEAAEAVPWTKPADLTYDPRRPLPKLGGAYDDVFLVALADGSAHFAKRTVSERNLRALITRNGGEIVFSYDWQFIKR